MVKYLYTDTLENTDINEDLMNLADKYELTQMKELCLPFFVKKVWKKIKFIYLLMISILTFDSIF